MSDTSISITGTADSGGAVGGLKASFGGAPYVGPVTLTGTGATPDPTPQTVLDDQVALAYSDGWNTASASTKFGGTERYTDTAGVTATLKLTTSVLSQVRIYGAVAEHHGLATLSLDGDLVLTFDCYRSVRAETQLLAQVMLDEGPHTVVVTCLGRHNPASAGSVIALDKLEVTGLVSYEPPPAPPPPKAGDFQLGICYTTPGPVGPNTPMPSVMGANLKRACTATAQHLSRSFGSGVGDHRGATDWSSLDIRVQNMAVQGASLKMIYLYAAPVGMSGLADYNYGIAQPTDIAGYASFCHDAVLRYLPRGVTHYPVWNELKGIGFDAYIKMYTAIWQAVKSDPRTASAQIGGPYAIMMNHQDNRWGGSLHGAWGGVDPQTTAFYERFLKLPHDFCAVDLSMGDIDGNSGGSYNPKGLPFSTTALYAKDCAAWLRARTTKPIVATEAYWGGPSQWAEFAGNFQAGGGNVFMLWHERDGVAGRLVNGDGNLTDLGNRWAAWQTANKKA